MESNGALKCICYLHFTWEAVKSFGPCWETKIFFKGRIKSQQQRQDCCRSIPSGYLIVVDLFHLSILL